MLTPDEFAALVQLLNRAAFTPIESLWLNSVLEKIAPKPAQAPTPPAETLSDEAHMTGGTGA